MATTEIYTLSLHDALPIWLMNLPSFPAIFISGTFSPTAGGGGSGLWLFWNEKYIKDARMIAKIERDRKSTRLNSSHVEISYAVFCLKKKIEEYLKTVSNSQ